MADGCDARGLAGGQQAPPDRSAEGCHALINDDTQTTATTIADVAVRDSSAIVCLRGEIDVANHDELRAALLAARASARELTIELAEVDFIDWTATAIIVGAINELRARGGRIELIAPRPHVCRLFRVMGLDELLSA